MIFLPTVTTLLITITHTHTHLCYGIFHWTIIRIIVNKNHHYKLYIIIIRRQKGRIKIKSSSMISYDAMRGISVSASLSGVAVRPPTLSLFKRYGPASLRPKGAFIILPFYLYPYPILITPHYTFSKCPNSCKCFLFLCLRLHCFFIG